MSGTVVVGREQSRLSYLVVEVRNVGESELIICETGVAHAQDSAVGELVVEVFLFKYLTGHDDDWVENSSIR